MKFNLTILLISVSILHGFGQDKSSSSKEGRTVQVITTAENTGFRLTATDTLSFSYHPQPFENEVCIFVDPAQTFQTFIGIGGALTDASAETFAKLSPDQQEKLLTAYFDPKYGIGYSLARTNIHSCDFSSSSYTYVTENDIALTSFNVAHDETYRIPFIKRAFDKAGGNLKLFVSPWSPPAWMKDNNSMLQGGKLLPAYYQSWADYYIKFIYAYEAHGIPVWGLSVQNEPMAKGDGDPGLHAVGQFPQAHGAGHAGTALEGVQ